MCWKRGRRDEGRTHTTQGTQQLPSLSSLILTPTVYPKSSPPLPTRTRPLFLRYTRVNKCLFPMLHNRQMPPPPPPNLFKHSSTSIAKTHIRLRLPLSLRAHLNARNKTPAFILNFLSPHRHQTRQHPLPPKTCHERILGKRWFFPLFPRFTSTVFSL